MTGGVAIRPLEPSDRDALAAGFERLSPESRYRRFFAPVARLTARQLDYLTQVDQHDHVALVAVDPETGQLVGVARFVRTGETVAEPAIVVADDWQRRGVGAALMNRLVERAREEGITRFAAPVLAHNVAAIRALKRLGDTTIEPHGREVEVLIDLPDEAPAAAASGPRAVLRAVARGTVDPAMVFWHRLLPRRGVPREGLRDVIVADGGAASLTVAGAIAAACGDAVVLAAAHHPLGRDAGELAAGLERDARDMRRRVPSVRTVVRRGDLGAILLDEATAERARLIVVADAGGDEGVAGRLVGSVWDHVSHHAPCDVLVARLPPR